MDNFGVVCPLLDCAIDPTGIHLVPLRMRPCPTPAHRCFFTWPPLRWLLSLAPGRTRQLYTLDAQQEKLQAVGSDSEVALPPEDPSSISTEIIISSLSGVKIYVEKCHCKT